ncbi:reticulon-1-like [Scyliorhinus canicula]|uniref:reticulon-1-like n=1 Tax=Scyliorhinus canicula TaxID=7830 RepID=UPI0018F4DBBA|nr:reticulon-1-like [Scyliorhinus canicula]
MGLHHFGQVMGQVLGFGHCKESASTVSTTPDSTPSSTEGVSDETDFLEPQTAQEHSDDDLQTDSSLYWGTPRQMSLESTLSCGTPLGQPSCFPGVFPSGSSPELRDFGEETNHLGVGKPAESDVPPRTKGRTSGPRGVVRTETIETFLAEEEDDTENYHLLGAGDRHTGQLERVIPSDLRDRPDCDPSPSVMALDSASIGQLPQETKAPELRLSGSETEPQAEGVLKGHPELELLLMEDSGGWENREIPEVQSAEVEMEEGRFVEGDASSQSDLAHGADSQPSTDPGEVMVAEGERASSDTSPQPVKEAEGMVGELELVEATGDEVASDTMETAGPTGMLMPGGALGIVAAELPGTCDCCVNTNNTIGCKHSLTLHPAPIGYEAQGVTEEETGSEIWQSPQQPSALDQSDDHKSQGLEAVDQTATDLLYWEDVKKTGTVFGAIILVLFSLTQFSGISVLAYLTLSVLSVTISLRLYTSALHLIYKTQEAHPFK